MGDIVKMLVVEVRALLKKAHNNRYSFSSIKHLLGCTAKRNTCTSGEENF